METYIQTFTSNFNINQTNQNHIDTFSETNIFSNIYDTIVYILHITIQIIYKI